MSKTIEKIFYHLVMADRENDLSKRLHQLSSAVSALKAKIQKDIPEDEELNFIVTYPALVGSDNLVAETERVRNKYDLIADELRSILPYYRELDYERNGRRRLGVLPEIHRAIEVVFSELTSEQCQKKLDELVPLYMKAYIDAEEEAERQSAAELHANLVLQYGKDAIYTILVNLGWDTVTPSDIFGKPDWPKGNTKSR